MSNSLSAYFDKSNQRKFRSHRGMIIRELSKSPGQHSYQLSDKLNLSNEAVKKRLNDLINDSVIEICGEAERYGNTQSLYKIKDQLSMFEVEKKMKLRKWLDINYPSILFEYDATINHKI